MEQTGKSLWYKEVTQKTQKDPLWPQGEIHRQWLLKMIC